jgi:hypothetical protein
MTKTEGIMTVSLGGFLKTCCCHSLVIASLAKRKRSFGSAFAIEREADPDPNVLEGGAPC